MPQLTQKAKKCAESLRKKIGKKNLSFYLITGSGQKEFFKHFNIKKEINTKTLPFFPQPSVKGHSNKILLCEKNGISFLIQSGRSHYYEKNSMDDVVFPLELANSLNIKRVLLLNSAGGVKKSLNIGDIVIITDHLNFMFRNPLLEKTNIPPEKRFVDLKPPYDEEFVKYLKKFKKKFYKFGIYAGVTGPVYETEAELSFLEKAGASVVGMSTVPEAIYANYLKIKINAISFVSNKRGSKASHNDVVKETSKKIYKLKNAVDYYISFIKEIVSGTD